MPRLQVSWLAGWALALAGCIALPTATPLPPTASQGPLSTVTLTPAATAPPVPNATPRPSAQPTPTSGLALTVREPDPDEVAAYFEQIFPDWQPGGVTGLPLDLDLLYAEVSGDSEDDLIVLNPPEVSVLVWQGERYAAPYRLYAGFQRGFAWSEVSFEDWTDDGTLEVVLDNRELGGGTAFDVSSWTRYLIHCQAAICGLAWSGYTLLDVEAGSVGGLVRRRAELRLDAASGPSLRYQLGGFKLYCCPDEERFPPDYLGVLTTTVETYAWNGSTFELATSQVLTPAHTIEAQSALTANNDAGNRAEIVIEPPDYGDGLANQICRLSVDSTSLGAAFECLPNFTVVAWQDITGDGQEEVVILALVGSFVETVPPTNGKHCVSQRLLAYEWQAGVGVEIASVSGCVIRDDLYGVRLEDVDGDGRPEILAADIDTASDEIYAWDGSEFELTDRRPGRSVWHCSNDLSLTRCLELAQVQN